MSAGMEEGEVPEREDQVNRAEIEYIEAEAAAEIEVVGEEIGEGLPLDPMSWNPAEEQVVVKVEEEEGGEGIESDISGIKVAQMDNLRGKVLMAARDFQEGEVSECWFIQSK